MSRRKRVTHLATAKTPTEGELLPAESGPVEAFTFGDPTPVLDGRELLD